LNRGVVWPVAGNLVAQSDDLGVSVLKRLARAPLDAALVAPVSPSKALRLAIIRAADVQVGLIVAVLGITEEVLPLEDLLRLIEDEHLLLALNGDQGLCGLAGIDLQTRAAVIEMQTTGTLRGTPAEPRAVTATDAAMLAPLVAGFLAEAVLSTVGTPLADWTAHYAVGGRVINTRAAGMTMIDTSYRLVRLTLDLGAGERQGMIQIALPLSPEMKVEQAPDAAAAWSADIARAVGNAPADLHAVLHRMRLSLRQVDGFHVGQLIAMPGITVGSVKLETADGRVVARARLGQITGLRAVRIQAPAPEEMVETPAFVGRRSLS
jgi:flagellar motor switch protein FliM